MSVSPFTQAGYFLIDTLFSSYILVFLLRFLLQVVRADFYNPVSQFIVRASNPLLIPARRLIPGFAKIDVAALVLIFLLTVLKLFCLSLVFAKTIPSFIGISIWVLGDLLEQVIQLYFYAILLQVLFSWIAPHQYNPLITIIFQLTTPLIRPIQRWIPPIAGFDLSPLFLIIGLQLLSILVMSPLAALGKALAHL